MARPASKLTRDIRKILDESNGEMTYGRSRRLLKKMGNKIPQQPKPASEHLEALLEYEFRPREVREVIRDTLGLRGPEARMLYEEYEIRRLFLKQRNLFDVTKLNWNKSRKQHKRTRSTKPRTNSKRVDEALTYVTKHGGLTKVKTKLDDQLKKIETKEEQIASLQARIEKMEDQILAIRADCVEKEMVIETLAALKAKLKDAA